MSSTCSRTVRSRSPTWAAARCTLARYVAARRPGSPQIVLEPDAALTAIVRARLPFARGTADPGRGTGGRPDRAGRAGRRRAPTCSCSTPSTAAGCRPSSRRPSSSPRRPACCARDGVLLANLADGPPLRYSRRRPRDTVAALLPHVALRATPAVFRGRRFGNVVLAASPGAAADTAELTRAAAPRDVPAAGPGGRRRCATSPAGRRAADGRRPDALARAARRAVARAVSRRMQGLRA